MAVRTRVDPIDRSFIVDLSEGEAGAGQSKVFADFAREAIAEASEQNRAATGTDVPYETFVDGRRGAPLESVKPDGTIVAVFDLMDDLFEWIGDMLVQNSPVLTGDYANSHIFFADGVEVSPGAVVPPAAEYVFLNLQPYARKIERGLSPQAPDGVYEAVAAMARRRFGGVANIKFSFRSFQEGGVVAYTGTGTRQERNRTKGKFAETPLAGGDERKRERDTRRPAIVIAPFGGR
ncbi:hypothetical protein [Xanthobacter autotrophicus]|uniref:hypothetical protein n=1 Tax=Xanthobacter autotrophicus TaxID=280 RepID=UPI0037296F4F